MNRRSRWLYLMSAWTFSAGCGDDADPLLPTSATGSPDTGGGPTTGTAASSTEPTTETTGESTATGPTTTGPTTTGETTSFTTTEALTSETTATSMTSPPPTCGDGELDDGEACDDGNDDDTDACTAQCKAPACDDGLQNGGESAVDCGGDCAPCGLGRGCVDDVDCESGECQANQCTAPCPSWARQWGSANTDQGRGVAVDGDDDVIVVGSLGSDLSVKKIDVAGTELWADVLDSGEIDHGLAVAVDAAGNAFVAGTTHGGLAGNVHIGKADAFIIKYAPDGAKLWSRQFGTNPDDRALGVAVDDAGNAVVVGLTLGSLDGNAAAGIEDIFVAKFDPQGVKLWTKQFGTSNYDSAWGVATGPNGVIVVAGTTAGSFDGNPSAGQGDALVLKLDAAGNKQWSRQFGAQWSDSANAAAIDDQGSIVVVGSSSGSLDGNVFGGQLDGFVVKYDASGAKQWIRQIGGTHLDWASSVVLVGADDIYVAGRAETGLDGNMAVGDADFFFVKYTGAGAKQWTQQFGTEQSEENASLARTSSGRFVIAGDTLGEIAGPQQGGGDIVAMLRCAP
ncbi:hypothetical protein SAMN02745121_07906 [Nannocystis exedens]|uniref:Myxococcus cysteine-rich repeat-containing protein n=2 Tax=Nannocystis exedens TaxID=54 RepID=A0A1I2HES8_9BACT|nr:Beta-propeller repeat protein [Nannocystis exedens]SFF28048.1 hypothetical protein SAMN02745121_07906 [Nannocystis exedens]